jgi:GR25 family glycosyltransferase involved in LPS biosynthesis
MKHADVWYELEDDVIFVPFFKEKLTRMILAARRSGVLRLKGSCAVPTGKAISNDERINQNPMFVIGTCYNFHGSAFQSNSSRARPVLTTNKSSPSRCTHAYLLTSCSAQAMVDQIHAQRNDFWPSDFMQNHLFRSSPTLQSFWMDPPLVYQGNQVTDLDNIDTFKKQTY